MLTIWAFLCRLSSYLYLSLGGYRYWSYVYRWLWEGKYRNIKLRTFRSLEELSFFVGGGSKWRRDSWKALFDAVSSPQRVQQIFSGAEPVPTSDLDCDDFMAFECNAVDRSLKAGLMVEDKVAKAYCLTITWLRGWRGGGHNVTLLEYKPRPDGMVWYSFMDYGGPSLKRPSIVSIVKLVRDQYLGEGKYVGLTWCVSEPNLKPKRTVWG